MSRSKVNRKKRSLSLFVCLFCFTSFCFTCFTRRNKLIAEHVECHVWSLKQAEEVVGGGDDTSFFFFLSLFFRFYKNYFIIIIFLFIFFFMKIIFIFSCSGMLRNVPECCAVACLSTPSLAVALLRSVHAWVARHWSSLSCVRLDFHCCVIFTCVRA